MTREPVFEPSARREAGALGTAFEFFVARHSVGSEWDKHLIELKRRHSWRVMDNALCIADALALPKAPRALCLAAGLLHDFGRFPQYFQYKTFHDGKSKNHAKLGVLHLRKEDVCAHMPLAARRLVLGSVMLHSRRFLPQGVSPALRCLTELIRDADKIDIIRIMSEHFQNPDASNPVITLHVKEDPEQYSPEFLEGILNGGTGDYRAMEWSNDFKVLLCGWVGQFNFTRARTLLAGQGHIFALMETLPKKPAMERLKERVRRLLEQEIPEPACLGALRYLRESETKC